MAIYIYGKFPNGVSNHADQEMCVGMCMGVCMFSECPDGCQDDRCPFHFVCMSAKYKHGTSRNALLKIT